MYRKTSNVVKSVGVGLAAVAAVTAIGANMKGKKRKNNSMRKTAGKAMHTVNAVLGDVEKMLR